LFIICDELAIDAADDDDMVRSVLALANLGQHNVENFCREEFFALLDDEF